MFLNPDLVSDHCIWYDIQSIFWLLYLQTLDSEPRQRNDALSVRSAANLGNAIEKEKPRCTLSLPAQRSFLQTAART